MAQGQSRLEELLQEPREDMRLMFAWMRSEVR